MPLKSHRSAASRLFDCLYDPNYVWASKKDADRASLSARSRAMANEKQTNYERMFVDNPKKTHRRRSHKEPSDADSLESCLHIRPESGRLAGGTNVCDNKGKGFICRNPIPCPPHQPDPNVNIMHLHLPEENQQQESVCYMKNFSRTRGTQTLYRESSAQTLPYLPGVSNDESTLETMELFKLPSILPGDAPPGLYEVEVLERARKRWAFKQALRIHFKNHIEKAREEIKKPKNKMIFEAFEWEYWIEREEHIQECQMMRLELLIRMFDKREKEMHDASKKRIEMSCKRINAKREHELRKNEMEFGREMRRLDMKHLNIPRNWRKENIAKELGDPSSEFYAPKMRYGVNPNRRHFNGVRKKFEERIDLLEKRVVGIKDLQCPFEKINAWAKPKTRLKELERNFCSEKNLKKLYESLKGLRQLGEKPKLLPRCLIERQQASPRGSVQSDTTITENSAFEDMEGIEEMEEPDSCSKKLTCIDHKKIYQAFLDEKRREEIENMIAKYEGTTIGWLMRFLAEEQQRLEKQRKLHLISMMAQKERCRRESLFALLKQKENELREQFEKMYENYESANEQVTKEFLDEILNVDMKVKADYDATEYITELAKLIDTDIQRWLKSFECIQNPLNYEPLRRLLKNLIFPNPQEFLAAAEPALIVQYIIEEVLFPHIFELLEPYDIGTMIANHTVDRLIDTDLEYFSSECSCCSDDEVTVCTEAQREAMAILRKVIRRAVPGRRWKTTEERLVYSNIEDIIDLALDNAFASAETTANLRGISLQKSRMDLVNPESSDSASCISLPDRIVQLQKVNFFDSPTHSELALTGTLKTDEVGEGNSDPHAHLMSEFRYDSSDFTRTLCPPLLVRTGKEMNIFDPTISAGEIIESSDNFMKDLGLLCVIFEGPCPCPHPVDKPFVDKIVRCVLNKIIPDEADEEETEDSESRYGFDKYMEEASSSHSHPYKCCTSDEDWFIRSEREYQQNLQKAVYGLRFANEETTSSESLSQFQQKYKILSKIALRELAKTAVDEGQYDCEGILPLDEYAAPLQPADNLIDDAKTDTTSECSSIFF